jgi:hypothetical protein
MRQRRLAHTTVKTLLLGAISLLLAVVLVSAKQRASTSTPAADQEATGSLAMAQMMGTVAPVLATATPAGSDVIAHPASNNGRRFTLHRAPTPPTFSEQEAIQIARSNSGAPQELGNQVTAVFGLATFGRPGGPGLPWLGSRNVRLPNGQVLDHIEKRPMWIVDFGNVDGDSGVSRSPTSTAPRHNHIVYAVDVQTRGVVLVWSYAGG